MITLLKKNIIFFSVFTVILAASVFLLLQDILLFIEIGEKKAQIKQKHKEYIKVRDPNNATGKRRRKDENEKALPVLQNAELINKDAEEMAKKTKELQRRFGAPYRKYLLKFAAETKIISEDQLYSEFKAHFEAFRVKDGDKELSIAEILNKAPHYVKDHIWMAFMEKYLDRLSLILTRAKAGKSENEVDPAEMKVNTADKTKIVTAYRNFINNIIKDPLFTVENLTPGNINLRNRIHYEIFASALGLPRIKSPNNCYTYLLEMQQAFVDKRLIPVEGVLNLKTVREFTYDKYEELAPRIADIPEILQAMPIYEDIGRRLRLAAAANNADKGKNKAGADKSDKSSIEKIEVTDMKKDAPVAEHDNKYLRYRFKLKLNCTLMGLRNFVNVLHEAYKDNRVYVVRWISVNAQSDKELESLEKILEGQSQNTASVNDRRRSLYGNRNTAAASGGISDYLDSLNEKYGTAIVGKNKEVTAEIDFDYYIYTGERVHTYQFNKQ